MGYVDRFFNPLSLFGKCSHCRSPEHLKRYCPGKPSSGPPPPDCPICQLGHSKAICPLAGCCTLCFERAHDPARCPHRPPTAPPLADSTASAPMPAAGRAADSVLGATPVGTASQPLPSSRRKDKQCYRCSQFGHTQAECSLVSKPEAPSAAQQATHTGGDGAVKRGPGPVCYNCHERGHVQADCPNRPEREASGPDVAQHPQRRTSRGAGGAERSANSAAGSHRGSSPAAVGEAQLVGERIRKWEKVSFRHAGPKHAVLMRIRIRI